MPAAHRILALLARGERCGYDLKFRRVAPLVLFAWLALTAGQAPAAQDLVLATTTSTEDSGLLEAILPAFEAQAGVRVKVVAVGTGQALKLARDGNADVVLVHARSKEDEFVAEGWGIDRRDVMFNDFVIVGPAADPALVRGRTTAPDAFAAIAAAKAPFASRGDESGTHVKEGEIWRKAGIDPRGAWYLSLGQGMGETLLFSNEKGAYTLTDRGTFLAMKERLGRLAILGGGQEVAENRDPSLLNPYGVIAVNPARHPHARHDLARKFIDWITSAETQARIGAFGAERFGQPLFHPNAAR